MSDIPIGNTGFDRCISWMTNWLMPRLPGSNERHILHEDMKKAYAELAQLRADLQAAQERSAEQAAQLEQARNNLSVMTNYCEHWLLTGRDMHGTNDLYILNAAIEASRSWLAANPAPEAEQP